MKQIYVHYNKEANINMFFLAQNVEWKFIDSDLIFYNTLFDSVLIVKPKNIELGTFFAEKLEHGCTDVLSLIEKTFNQSPQSVYSLFVNKKIIE